MKINQFKTKAVMIALVSTSLSAFGEVNYQTAAEEAVKADVVALKADGSPMTTKDFVGSYWLSLTTAGSNIIRSTEEYSYDSQGCLYFDTAGFLEVNLRLPDGHRINGIRHYYKDGDTGNSNLQLYRATANGSFTALHTVTSTGDTGTYTSLYENLTTPHFVDNANNAYVARFYSSTTGSTQQMCGIRLNMTATP